MSYRSSSKDNVSNTSSNVSSSREKKGLFFVQIYAAAKSEDEDEALEALNELKDILSEEVRANEVLSKGKLVGWDEPYLEEDEGVFVVYDNFFDVGSFKFTRDMGSSNG